MDYWPHIIAILSMLTSVIIVYLQYKANSKANKAAIIYGEKKEILYDALSFLDTYISWLTPDSGHVPVRRSMTVLEMTERARVCYNQLCLFCDDNKILQIFWKIINPNNPGAEYPVYELYNEFRNECRKELDMDSVDLPDDFIFISEASTAELSNEN